MKCAQADTFMHAYVDGELAGVDSDTYERHLLECDHCSRCCRLQARFKAAVRGHLLRREVPEGLRRRIETAIASAPPPPRRWRWQLYPKLFPALVAAGALTVIFVSTRRDQPLDIQQAMRTFRSAMPMDVVASSCERVAEWFRGKVDFPVRTPAEAAGVRCEGGKLLPYRDQLAAFVKVRTISGNTVAIMVYAHDDEEPIFDLPTRRINGMNLRVVSDRGASSAAFEGADGLRYVVTGDLDPDSLANFFQAAYRH